MTSSPLTAKLFSNGRSQAVRLPAAYRFSGTEVFIRQNLKTGEVILSQKPLTWEGFFQALENTPVPKNFLNKRERSLKNKKHDPFQGWKE